MWTMWSELGRELDRVFRELDGRYGPTVTGAWPRANLWDRGGELVLEAEVPGLAQKDIQVTATADSVTLAGERKLAAPEGYAVHRQERAPLRFQRTFALPVRVDLEKVAAQVRNGILTITMAKAQDAKPRQITVKG